MANLEKLRRNYGEVLWTGKKCICGLPISLTRYILTETSLYTKVGLLNIKEDEIDLYKIMDKNMKFTFGQRIVGCGTIILIARDRDTPEKQLRSIRKPREVKRILDQAVKAQYDKYMVRGRDMVGAALGGQPADIDMDGDGIADSLE